jgi:hypothetical protein
MISAQNLKPRGILSLIWQASADAVEVYDLYVGRAGAAFELMDTLGMPDLASGSAYAELIRRLPATDKSLTELEAELNAIAAGVEWRKLFRLPLEDHPFYGGARLAATLLSGWRAAATRHHVEKFVAALFEDHSRPAADAE